MPGKIAAVHHSLTDWDFQQGETGRSLSADYFISSPTSLKLETEDPSMDDCILCRIPATLSLPQGEVRTWLRSTMPFLYPVVFRNQSALGNSGIHNTYGIVTFAAETRLYRYIAGGFSIRDTTDPHYISDTWIHYRTFWYNGETPALEPALCVDFYYEDAGEWVKIGDTMYDTDNSFADSDINRCGIYVGVFEDNPVYFDDTEIWGPIPA